MAHTKAGGTVKTGRDSQGQRLGIKRYAGEIVQPGNILLRQKGMEVYAGKNVAVASDHSLFATGEGVVSFERKHKKKFNNQWVSTKFVNVIPKK